MVGCYNSWNNPNNSEVNRRRGLFSIDITSDPLYPQTQGSSYDSNYYDQIVI